MRLSGPTESTGNNGETPLFEAARGGHNEVAQLLFDNGAEIDINIVNSYGTTFLHAAACVDIRNLTEQLIAKGADVNAKDYDRATPLFEAAEKGHLEIVASRRK